MVYSYFRSHMYSINVHMGTPGLGACNRKASTSNESMAVLLLAAVACRNPYS